jgi:magnesium-transporting ATPase (P-type)
MFLDFISDTVPYLDTVTNHFGYTFLTFFILFNNLIPISLQITIDLVKFIQAYFINWVENMNNNHVNRVNKL